MTESDWYGFKRIDFEFEGKNAAVIFPKEEDKNGKWLYKTEYLYAFPKFETEMLKRGWHVAYVENITRWCMDEDIDRKKRFADYIISEYGLYKKCIPVGMSCGGMIAVKFAAKYPEYVSALYLDAPVMNMLSCPADFGIGHSNMMEEFLENRNMSVSELICYREHPIDKIPDLYNKNIPIFLVYGTVDDVVPYCENGAILEKYYKEHGGVIEIVAKENCGHHPHCLEDCTPIIEFAQKYMD